MGPDSEDSASGRGVMGPDSGDSAGGKVVVGPDSEDSAGGRGIMGLDSGDSAVGSDSEESAVISSAIGNKSPVSPYLLTCSSGTSIPFSRQSIQHFSKYAISPCMLLDRKWCSVGPCKFELSCCLPSRNSIPPSTLFTILHILEEGSQRPSKGELELHSF